MKKILHILMVLIFMALVALMFWYRFFPGVPLPVEEGWKRSSRDLRTLTRSLPGEVRGRREGEIEKKIKAQRKKESVP